MSFLYNLKTRFKKWAVESEFGYAAFQRVRNAFVRVMALQSDDRYAHWFYKTYTGRTLNLKDPQRFDEKLWWLKLNNRDPMLTLCSDKYRVRDYVRDCGLSDILIPELGVYDRAEDIDFSAFPEETILKCNHGSGENFFVQPNVPINEKSSRHKLNYARKQKYYLISREWNYKNIPPKIVADKVMRDKAGHLPLDYKFMCFDGEPKLLFLDLQLVRDDGSYDDGYPRNIYDMDFHLLPVWETRKNADYPVEKPENFARMVEVARRLAKPFPHCRVDLYNLDGAVYFGEITFYHGGGCNDIQPEEWDYKMGSWIDLNSPKIVREEKKHRG